MHPITATIAATRGYSHVNIHPFSHAQHLIIEPAIMVTVEDIETITQGNWTQSISEVDATTQETIPTSSGSNLRSAWVRSNVFAITTSINAEDIEVTQMRIVRVAKVNYDMLPAQPCLLIAAKKKRTKLTALEFPISLRDARVRSITDRMPVLTLGRQKPLTDITV